jgi:hypothetical protein
MKSKTGFESGTSPTNEEVKVSVSGAPIQTGRGLEETKRRILEAFEKIRCDGVHARPVPRPRSEAEVIYTEKQAAVFRTRVRALSAAALTSSAVTKYNASRRDSYDLGTIDGPQPTADQLIAAAMASR